MASKQISTASIVALVVLLPLLVSAQSQSLPGTAVLSFGSRGERVIALQQKLVKLGYLLSDSVTGYFGSGTREAVRAFQCEKFALCSGSEQQNGYGAVGPRTRAALDAYLAGAKPGDGVTSKNANLDKNIENMLAEIARLKARLLTQKTATSSEKSIGYSQGSYAPTSQKIVARTYGALDASSNEFTAGNLTPTIDALSESSQLGNIRQWIGFSDCASCEPLNMRQNIYFSNVAAGQTVTISVTSRVSSSNQTLTALVTSGKAEILSGATQYFAIGATPTTWNIVLRITETSDVTISLGHGLTSGANYVYLDQIKVTPGLVQNSYAQSAYYSQGSYTISPRNIPERTFGSIDSASGDFTSGSQSPVIDALSESSQMGNIRQWIGFSDCASCSPLNSRQNISFSNVAAGQTITISLTTRVSSSNQTLTALVTSGKAEILSGASKYFPQGTVPTTWNIVLKITEASDVTVSVGHGLTSGANYVYLDQIKITPGVVSSPNTNSTFSGKYLSFVRGYMNNTSSPISLDLGTVLLNEDGTVTGTIYYEDARNHLLPLYSGVRENDMELGASSCTPQFIPLPYIMNYVRVVSGTWSSTANTVAVTIDGLTSAWTLDAYTPRSLVITQLPGYSSYQGYAYLSDSHPHNFPRLTDAGLAQNYTGPIVQNRPALDGTAWNTYNWSLAWFGLKAVGNPDVRSAVNVQTDGVSQYGFSDVARNMPGMYANMLFASFGHDYNNNYCADDGGHEVMYFGIPDGGVLTDFLIAESSYTGNNTPAYIAVGRMKKN